MGWTDQRCDMLRAMCAEGLAYSQIGAELGVSRNAAIGKAARLGIAKQDATPRSTPRPHPKHRPIKRVPWQPSVKLAEPPPAPEPMPDTPDEQIPPEQRRQLHELTNTTCRWPVGTPGHDDFFYCGHESADLIGGRPYCPSHHARAFTGHGRAPDRFPWGARG